MARVMLEAWGITLVIGLLGALLGFGLELVSGQVGWALVGASIALCGGAMLAGARATVSPPGPRPRSSAARSAPPSTAPTE